jgi:hypothetical protein
VTAKSSRRRKEQNTCGESNKKQARHLHLNPVSRHDVISVADREAVAIIFDNPNAEYFSGECGACFSWQRHCVNAK